MKWLDSITDSTDMSLGELQETARDRDAWSATVHWVTKQLDNNRKTTTYSNNSSSNNYLLSTSVPESSLIDLVYIYLFFSFLAMPGS